MYQALSLMLLYNVCVYMRVCVYMYVYIYMYVCVCVYISMSKAKSCRYVSERPVGVK